jgi:hypothetical protein
MIAIHGTSAKTLRSVMNRMCKSNPEVKRVTESLLLIRGSDLPDAISGQERKLEEISGSEMVPRYNTCANCELEFDVGANKENRCVWHTGEFCSEILNGWAPRCGRKEGER